MFTLAPFAASLDAIPYKIFVLITLALGARTIELCALRRGQFVCLAEDWSFMLLYSDPSFIPKTAKARLPTEPYKLRALLPGAPPRDDATVSCPVRALKAYMEKTADSTLVNNRETLFLPRDRTHSLSHYCLSKLFALLQSVC